MLKGKKGPYILIILLVTILIFILGVQYGKRVKITDTAISFLLSITPQPTAPKPETITYKLYEHKPCDLSFLYPSYLKISKESSSEAQISSKNKDEFINIRCAMSLPTPANSSPSAKISLDGYQANSYLNKLKIKNKNVVFETYHVSRNGKIIEIRVNEELAPLINTSLKLR